MYIFFGIESFKIIFRLKENEEKAHVLEEEKQQFDEQAQELNETIKVGSRWTLNHKSYKLFIQ